MAISAEMSTALQALALSNCARERIQSPDSIQAYGALIVTDCTLSTITHVSANIGEFIGQPSTLSNTKSNTESNTEWITKQLLGQPLHTLFSMEALHELCNVCGLPTIHKQPERIGTYLFEPFESRALESRALESKSLENKSLEHKTLTDNREAAPQPLDITVHVSGVGEAARTVIELTVPQPNQRQQSTSMLQVKTMLDQLCDPSTMLEVAVNTLRQKTGFDRVMAYQFLSDGTGEVVAEACAPSREPYLGLRYPASDIPQQVRSLALKTSLRVISDTQIPPVPILAINAEEEPPLDLSLTALRSVSPIHLEYLENMGIQSTLNISIVVDNQLWGLFAFHHTYAKPTSPETCDILALFGQLFSLRFQQVLTEKSFGDRKRAASILENILNQKTPDSTWKTTIIQAHKQLSQLLSAQGIAFVSKDRILSTQGDVPMPRAIITLSEYCQQQANSDIMTLESFQQLGLSTVKNLDWGKCAGALLFTLPSNEPLHLIFFRNEMVHEVRWGGNPEKKEIAHGAFGPRLRPRASFAEYQETMRGRCESWGRSDLAIALEIRTELLRLVEDRIQSFQQRQQNLLVAELNHRVKNILALIRSIARQTKESAKSLTDYTTLLEQRITALATAHDLVASHNLEWPTLEQLLSIELRPYLVDEHPRVQLIGETVNLKASFVPTFVLVLHELTTNAAKHGALSQATGRLVVSWYANDGGLTLQWTESQGPQVTPPQRSGFGRKLIERAIPYEFEGEAELRFKSTGVEAQFWLPSDLVRWQSTEAPTPVTTHAEPPTPEAPPSKTLGPVLIVEDNMLLTMEMESILKQLGFSHIDAAPSVARAQKLLANNHYCVCVLDINLRKETSFEIARTLVQQRIPFAFTSGYDAKHTVPEDLSNQILVKKPIELAKLKMAFQTLIDL